jgi:ATP-binding cassette subfamily B protein
VLDEATARVDPETEARLEAAIAELLEGRTALVIAHRLSTLQRVDEIVVFDHGRIVEYGAREELAGAGDSRFNRLLSLSLEIEDPVGAVSSTRGSEPGEA